jgi:hypothetical protein
LIELFGDFGESRKFQKNLLGSMLVKDNRCFGIGKTALHLFDLTLAKAKMLDPVSNFE